MPTSLWAFYNPSTGRWLNRDPIEASGGNSLHGFVANARACATALALLLPLVGGTTGIVALAYSRQSFAGSMALLAIVASVVLCAFRPCVHGTAAAAVTEEERLDLLDLFRAT